jgi:hydroxypyruvate isomerase
VDFVGTLLTLLSPPTVTVATGRQARERCQSLKGNKFHEGIGQALHYGDVTGQQPVLALIRAYDDISDDERQKLEYVSDCAWRTASRYGREGVRIQGRRPVYVVRARCRRLASRPLLFILS